MANSNEKLQQAISAARSGNKAEATSLVDELLEENPQNPHALFLRGMLSESQEEQLSYMNQVLAIDPNHKAAQKRTAQLEVQMEVVPAEEPVVEAVEEELPVEEVVEEELPIEEAPLEDTMIAAAPPADDLFEEAHRKSEEAPDEIEEAPIEATVIAAAPLAEDLFDETPSEVEETLFGSATTEAPSEIEELPFQDTPEEGVEEESGDLAATLVGAAAVGAVLDDQAPAVEDDIPDWLFEEAQSEEGVVAADDTDLWTDEVQAADDDLPDWLREEPVEDFETFQAEEEPVFAPTEPEEIPTYEEVSGFEEPPVEEVVEPVDDLFLEEADEVDEPVDDLFLEEADEADEPVEAVPVADEPAPVKAEKPKRKKSSSTRWLEILLVILVVVAIAVVAGLAYLILNPPF